MSDETTRTADGGGTGSGGARKALRALPRWKKVLLTIAAFLAVGGLALHGYGWARGDGDAERLRNVSTPRESSKSSADDLLGAQRSFAPWDGGSPTEGTGTGETSETSGSEGAAGPNSLSDWSPALVKGGFGFLLAFCLGYVFRVFARLSTLFVGLFLLGVLGLSYVGFVEVHWEVAQAWFDRAMDTFREQSAGFQTFVASSLPTAGASAVGFFTGFKKS
jgi:uncharacterized membrane protein (Fun14 family)